VSEIEKFKQRRSISVWALFEVDACRGRCKERERGRRRGSSEFKNL